MTSGSRSTSSAYTNAATLVHADYRDAEDLGGLLPVRTGRRAYDTSSWAYAEQGEGAIDEPGPGREHGAEASARAAADTFGSGGPPLEHAEVQRDDTLQDPRTVFQIVKRHYARYTPEMVRDMCGIDVADFEYLARSITENSGTRADYLLCLRGGPHRVESLRRHIRAIVDSLLETHLADSRIELMGDFANRLPAIVMAEMLGVPTSDHEKLKAWSADFAEILGNLQHNADSAARTLRSLEEMSNYFQAAIQEQREHPGSGLIAGLITAQLEGQHLSEESIIANCILLTVGGQETTPNLIGNGMLSLLRHPDQMSRLRQDPSLLRLRSRSCCATRLPASTQLASLPRTCAWVRVKFKNNSR